MNIALWIVQVLLGVAFLMAGGMKSVTPVDELIANGMAWAGHVPPWLVRFIGVSEIAGGLGLILPSALRIKPKLTPLAAALLALVMVLAAGTHAMLGEFGPIAANVVLGGLAVFVAWGRAKKLPIAPRASRRQNRA